MYFLPAIDILDGRVTRLAQGDYSRATIYDSDAALQAQVFEEDGADRLHVVDLNGARTGDASNIDVIRKIMDSTSLKVEVGGGIRSLDAIRRLADIGVARVVLGTALVKDPDLAQAAREEFGPDMLVCGIDARDGEVKVEGWEEGSGISALELAGKMADVGYEHLVFTDIARDGMQTGVDADAYVEMFKAFRNPVIASGGIASLADLQKLAAVDDAIEGVIAGRAIYEGAFSVADAVAVCAGTMIVE